MLACRHEHLPLGTGDVDFAPLLAALAAGGYAGGLHVELPRQSHRWLATARESARFLRSAARSLTSGPASGPAVTSTRRPLISQACRIDRWSGHAAIAGSQRLLAGSNCGHLHPRIAVVTHAREPVPLATPPAGIRPSGRVDGKASLRHPGYARFPRRSTGTGLPVASPMDATAVPALQP